LIKIGVYSLIIKTEFPINLVIGALGKVNLPAGYYVYVGSALSGIQSRIQRHLIKNKKLHWHIDYLLNHDKVSVKTIMLAETLKKHECSLSKTIDKDLKPKIVIPKFGSTDCRKCKSHLYYFGQVNVSRLIGSLKRAFCSVGLDPVMLKIDRRMGKV
jgi:Uri superfamily endonuclease